MNCRFIILIMLPNLAFIRASGLFGIYLNCHNNLLYDSSFKKSKSRLCTIFPCCKSLSIFCKSNLTFFKKCLYMCEYRFSVGLFGLRDFLN